jgi:hypothetical protein
VNGTNHIRGHHLPERRGGDQASGRIGGNRYSLRHSAIVCKLKCQLDYMRGSQKDNDSMGIIRRMPKSTYDFMKLLLRKECPENTLEHVAVGGRMAGINIPNQTKLMSNLLVRIVRLVSV